MSDAAVLNYDSPVETETKPSGLRRLVGNGFWAIADQGFFAGSNFILNIVLARWLSPNEYGAFGVAFSIFLLVGTLHSSLLTEPMTVFAPGKFRAQIEKYLGICLYGHVAFAALCCLLLLIAAGIVKIFGSAEIASALVGLAAAGPFILYLWLMRRACYVQWVPSLAAWGGGIYMALMMGGIYLLYRGNLLSAASAQGVMGASSLIVAVWLTLRLRIRKPDHSREFFSEIAREHWEYGRWAAATQGLGWLPRQIYYVLLPACRDLAQSASLRALMNLTLPLTQASTALAIVLIPALVRARRYGHFKSMVHMSLLLFVAGGAFYWAVLVVLQRPLIDWVYNGRYAEHAWLLWLVGASLVTGGVIDVIGSALRAMERPDQMFWSNLVSTLVAVAAGLVCMWLWGVVGAAIGLVLSSALKAVAMWVYYRRLERSVVERAEEYHASGAEPAI